MKANNQISTRSAAQEGKISFSAAITSKSMQDMILKSVPDSKAAARLTGTLISVVNSNEQLRQCEATSIVSAALRGEGMGLILGHGYYVVPFGKMATFILGYKGMIGLAMATGYYADIDCIDVREGELHGINRRTCKPEVDFSTYSTLEERAEHNVIGYYAYFELKDGTFRYEYWSVDKILRHADHYSKAFSLKSYQDMVSGNLSAQDVERLRRGSPWYDVGGGQDNMFRKTVLRQLLNSGYAPLSNEVRSILRNDTDDPIIPAVDAQVDASTGEVIETTGVVMNEQPEQATEPETEEAPQKPTEATTSDFNQTAAPVRNAAKKSASPRRRAAEAEESDDAFQQAFFGE